MIELGGSSLGGIRMEIKKTHIISSCTRLLTRRRLLSGLPELPRPA